LTHRNRRVIKNDRILIHASYWNMLMAEAASNLQIDSARLWDTIHETAKFGATPKGGVRRLTLGPEDKQVRDWFRNACEAAGCEVHVDALGSMFGLRKGRDMSKLPVGLGSHLDTQPTGGKFDGILGTLAALEVVRTLNDAGIETDTPICIVNWTNEEGSRFAPAMMASAAYAGDYTTEDILSRKDAAGVSVGEALDSIGYRGEEAVGARKLGAFVELHIEQGPILEAENKTIGVVDRGQGIAWYDGHVTGFESHAGTTPMPLRKDALAAFAEFVLAVERIAKAHGPNAVGTVGEAVIAAPSRNVIPGDIAFTTDIRSPSADTLNAIDKDLRSAIAEINARRKVEIALDLIWRKEPTIFNPQLVDAVENATKTLGYSHRRITSGAGHDACNLAGVVPTAMIFVPCKDGVSHNELEDATQADCAAGANILLHTVLSLAGVAS
jgi:N-carbamoyl-L-amino-acid hydrolase